MTTHKTLRIDVAGFTFGIASILWGFLTVLKVQPSFEVMFSAFGGIMPLFTAFCLKPWLPLTLSVIPLVVMTEGVLRKAERKGRMARFVFAVLWTLVWPAVVMVGLYLPIFELNSALMSP